MSKSRWVKFIKRLQALPRQRSKSAGFTLIELLVSIIIGSLITIALLGLVVQLTETNQRDAGRSQIQQDMQAAIDYIAQDLRESVFVYNGECLQGNGGICPGVVNYIPAEMRSGTRTPVLALWRTDPLPPNIAALCRANAAALADRDQSPTNVMTVNRVPCISGTTYSLVVYALETAPSPTWQGNARILRYKLSQFTDSATAANQQSGGYVNPLAKAEYTFQQWPLDASNVDRRLTEAIGGSTPNIGNNPPQVLVDFVDDTIASPLPTCNEFIEPGANPLTPSVGNIYSSFYACVRGGGTKTDAAGRRVVSTTGANQDVLLTLVGNTSGLSGFSKQYDNSSRLSPIQTRVLIRGVIQKK